MPSKQHFNIMFGPLDVAPGATVELEQRFPKAHFFGEVLTITDDLLDVEIWVYGKRANSVRDIILMDKGRGDQITMVVKNSSNATRRFSASIIGSVEWLGDAVDAKIGS